MRAKILESERKIFDGEITKIVIPAAEGEMCLLPHHAPIITIMKAGAIRVFRTTSERPLTVDVTGGLFSFRRNNAVCILKTLDFPE
ncbi:MAG: hypothetical protein LBB63_03600 [Holosporaceae bacterium]|nr:hypothetical protein [Holosporaceae bacterium]